MDYRNTVLLKVNNFRNLQNQFATLCKILIGNLLSPENDYGIEICSIGKISADITVLDLPCRMVFSMWGDAENRLGKITFQRLLPREQTADFLSIFYDDLGNIKEKLEDGWFHTIQDNKMNDWLVIKILDEFFKSHTAEQSS